MARLYNSRVPLQAPKTVSCAPGTYPQPICDASTSIGLRVKMAKKRCHFAVKILGSRHESPDAGL